MPTILNFNIKASHLQLCLADALLRTCIQATLYVSCRWSIRAYKLIKRALKHLNNICNIFTIDFVWFYIAYFFLTVRQISFTKYALCLGPQIALSGQREWTCLVHVALSFFRWNWVPSGVIGLNVSSPLAWLFFLSDRFLQETYGSSFLMLLWKQLTWSRYIYRLLCCLDMKQSSGFIQVLIPHLLCCRYIYVLLLYFICPLAILNINMGTILLCFESNFVPGIHEGGQLLSKHYNIPSLMYWFTRWVVIWVPFCSMSVPDSCEFSRCATGYQDLSMMLPMQKQKNLVSLLCKLCSWHIFNFLYIFGLRSFYNFNRSASKIGTEPVGFQHWTWWMFPWFNSQSKAKLSWNRCMNVLSL